MTHDGGGSVKVASLDDANEDRVRVQVAGGRYIISKEESREGSACCPCHARLFMIEIGENSIPIRSTSCYCIIPSQFARPNNSEESYPTAPPSYPHPHPPNIDSTTWQHSDG